MLFGCESEPASQFASISKAMRIADTRHECGACHNTDAGDLELQVNAFVVLCERFEIRFSLFDFGIQGDHLFEQIVVQVSHGGRDILLRKNGANAWFNRTCTQGYKEADFA